MRKAVEALRDVERKFLDNPQSLESLGQSPPVSLMIRYLKCNSRPYSVAHEPGKAIFTKPFTVQSGEGRQDYHAVLCAPISIDPSDSSLEIWRGSSKENRQLMIRYEGGNELNGFVSDLFMWYSIPRNRLINIGSD